MVEGGGIGGANRGKGEMGGGKSEEKRVKEGVFRRYLDWVKMRGGRGAKKKVRRFYAADLCGCWVRALIRVAWWGGRRWWAGWGGATGVRGVAGRLGVGVGAGVAGRAAPGGGDDDAGGDGGGADVDVDAAVFLSAFFAGGVGNDGALVAPAGGGDAVVGDVVGVEDFGDGPAAVGGEDPVGGVHLHGGGFVDGDVIGVAHDGDFLLGDQVVVEDGGEASARACLARGLTSVETQVEGEVGLEADHAEAFVELEEVGVFFDEAAEEVVDGGGEGGELEEAAARVCCT